MNRPEINVTPLIDVLLVLLIIFMIITPIKPMKVEAKAPREPANDNAEIPLLALVVTLDHNGQISLNNESILSSINDPNAIIIRLQEIFIEREKNRAFAAQAQIGGVPKIEKTVFIRAPRDLDYGSVIRVVDAVKLSGADPVGLQLDGID